MLSPAEQRTLKQYVAEDSRRLSEVFDALSDNNRCRLFRLFAKNDTLNVTEIAALLSLSVPLTSQHLRVLEQSRILIREKTGRQVFYRLNTKDAIVSSIVRAIIT